MLNSCMQNQLKFSWVLFDIWLKTLNILTHEKDFISALKGNRLVALSEKDKLEGRFTRVDQLVRKGGRNRLAQRDEFSNSSSSPSLYEQRWK